MVRLRGSSTYSTPAAHNRSPEATADLRERDARARDGNHDLAPAQRLVPAAREDQIGGDPERAAGTAGEHDERAVHMQHRARQGGLRQQATSPSSAAASQREGQRAEGDHGGDLLGRQAQHRIGPETNRAAAQGVQSDVVADRVAHEGDQGEPRIGHPRAGESQTQRVVQRQAAVAGSGQQDRAPELRGADGLHVRQDVLPPVLADHVVQPEEGHPEQGDAEQRRPRPGPCELCVEVSSRVSYQGSGRAVHPAVPSGALHFPAETARVMLLTHLHT